MAAMAARATRSASRAAAHTALSERIRDAEAAATGPLGALSHDELGVIFDGLADPLQPTVAVALSSTCLGLRTPLWAALEVLKERYERAVALCRRGAMHPKMLSPASLSDQTYLAFYSISDESMATLGMILRLHGLPRLKVLELFSASNGSSGMISLCEGMGPGSLPALTHLNFENNRAGPAGAEALATAFSKGAMPRLERLCLLVYQFGKRGWAALAKPLRRLPGLCYLDLDSTGLCDEGLASLVANLGKDKFKALKSLNLQGNQVGDLGCRSLVMAIVGGRMPLLETLDLYENPASQAAQQSVLDAVRSLSYRTAEDDEEGEEEEDDEGEEEEGEEFEGEDDFDDDELEGEEEEGEEEGEEEDEEEDEGVEEDDDDEGPGAW